MEMAKREKLAYEITKVTLKDKNGNLVGFVADDYAKQIADALYNAGYRKTFTSDLASDTQAAFKEGYEKALYKIAELNNEIIAQKIKYAVLKGIMLNEEITRQQAVKEFAEKLKEYAKACKASGYDGIGENDIDGLLKEYEK